MTTSALTHCFEAHVDTECGCGTLTVIHELNGWQVTVETGGIEWSAETGSPEEGMQLAERVIRQDPLARAANIVWQER